VLEVEQDRLEELRRDRLRFGDLIALAMATRTGCGKLCRGANGVIGLG
jgi:hypothetical protein